MHGIILVALAIALPSVSWAQLRRGAITRSPGIIQDGTVGSPGLRFANDTDTGLFRPAANAQTFVTTGSTRAVISGANFGIGNLTPTLPFQVHVSSLVLTSAGSVGIGTSAPGVALDVTAGEIAPIAATRATIDARSPGKVGGLIVCSNCATAYTLCISTGTGADQYMNIDGGGACR